MAVLTGEQQSAVLDRFTEAVEQVWLLPTDEQVAVLDSMIGRLQAWQAAGLRRLETDGSLEGTGCKSARTWATLHLRRDASAHRAVRRAKTLPDLPGFADAWAEGAVTDEHLDTVVRGIGWCGLAAVQKHETTLVRLARDASPRELKQALDHLADLEDPDRDQDKVTALGRRSFKARKVGDLVHVDAMVEPALGEALKTAVESGARLPAGVKAADDGRTRAQRYADAFCEIVLRGISPEADQQPAAGRLRPQISVTVSLEYLRGLEGAPKPLLDHFGVLPMPTVHRLICDGDLARVVLDTATGRPLDVGRNSRLANKRQRRALRAIFGHCAFPGCTVPFRFCEIHHLDWWSRGGATDLHLLVPYCWTHHHFLHESGYTLTRETTRDGDRLIHRRPDGHQLLDPAPPLGQAIAQLTLDTPPVRDGPSEPRHPPRVA